MPSNPAPLSPEPTPPIPRVDQRAAQAAAELLDRRKIRSEFQAWCEHALKPMGQFPAQHHRLIIEHLQKVSAGAITKLIIMAPPGSAKSTYTSSLFAPFFMANHPNSTVIGASNTSKLAMKFSRLVRENVRNNAKSLNLDVKQDQTAVEQWACTNGSDYIAVGTGGSVLGNRADLVICDDPYASREDAQSPGVRESIWNWFSSDIMSRLKPGGRVVVVMTRFHLFDLCGQLQETEPGEWTILRLPAICDDPDNDPLGRAEGELLWPEYHDQAFLDGKKTLAGAYDWASNYQQTPYPQGGTLFESDKLTTVDQPPQASRTVRAWDLAATQKGDWSVGLKLVRDPSGRYCITDLVRFRGPPEVVEQTIRDVAQADGPSCTIALARDPGSAGLSYNQYLVRSLAGYNIKTSTETGSKEVRAQAVASQVNVGNVTILRAAWNDVLRAEASSFPGGRHDDSIDALSRAFNEIAERSAGLRTLPVDFMRR